ncbi:MAG: NnrS family protein [Roseateles sp.]|uniref:NnrS family protein n=1 Tax=Roseateles sp. TaxID=1971397 RepID=UPI0040350094
MTPLLRIDEPLRPAPRGFALFALGFRPFYLLASVFAALSVPLWTLQYAGLLGVPYLAGPIWHAHEMLFGFTLAVIVGFLFTAGRNWTNLPTPTGGKLAALAALWLAARVLVLTPYALAAAVANVAFPLAAAVALGVPFVKAGNRRNYFFVGLLALLSLAAGCVHLAQFGVVAVPGWLGIQVGLDVVLFILVVMGGRVIPMFTNNGVPGAGAARSAWVEQVALGSVVVLLAADAFELQGLPLAAIALAACAAHAWRWALWRPWRTLRVPIVWVLHLAYLWIPVYLLLRGLAELGWLMPSLATHALTVGAVGGLVIGMMTRTARGHTGRPLKADRYEVACYLLVASAAAVRVVLPLVAPAQLIHAALASALLWSAGFGLYAVRYWPVLSRPRLDGRPG